MCEHLFSHTHTYRNSIPEKTMYFHSMCCERKVPPWKLFIENDPINTRRHEGFSRLWHSATMFLLRSIGRWVNIFIPSKLVKSVCNKSDTLRPNCERSTVSVWWIIYLNNRYNNLGEIRLVMLSICESNGIQKFV